MRFLPAVIVSTVHSAAVVVVDDDPAAWITPELRNLYCIALTGSRDSVCVYESKCLVGGALRPVSCSTESMVESAGNYTRLHTRLCAMVEMHCIRNFASLDFSAQLQYSDYAEFLANEQPLPHTQKVKFNGIGSMFSDPALAYSILTEIYLTVPGATWTDLELPKSPGYGPQWMCVLEPFFIPEKVELFEPAMTKAMLTRAQRPRRRIPHHIVDLLLSYIAPATDPTEYLIKFFALAAARRVKVVKAVLHISKELVELGGGWVGGWEIHEIRGKTGSTQAALLARATQTAARCRPRG